jgi:hypothetical protein
MAGSMLLGPVLFRDFELPGRVSWGGVQRLSVHELPGGRRVIDAMGRGDAPIAWEGTFSGEDAAMRARLLDLMRADGGVWPLTWGRFFYSVVIQAFSVQYERAEWMPYRIVCAVLRDEVEGVVEDGLSLIQGVGADLFAADQAGSGVDFAAAQDGLAVPGAGRLGGGGYGPARLGVGGVRAAVEGVVAVAEEAVSGAGFGGFGALDAAGDAAGALARGGMARGYARRASVNLNNAGS